MADMDLKYMKPLQYMSCLEHRSELRNWDSDIQTPSLECISAESTEINRLRKQIC